MKVFIYTTRPYDQPALQAAAAGHELFFTESRLTIDTAPLAQGCQAISIFTSDDASALVLERLHACGVRYMLLRCVGYDHVDLAKANELGIRVANVPEYSPYSVAEHAVAMFMAINRKLIHGQRLIDLQDFRIDTLKGFDVHGKTVGVVATGKIGMAFTRIMLGFGAKILAFDPQVNSDAVNLGVKYVTLNELLKHSDVISLHCPLTPTTRHMISEVQFGLMKPNCILINTSRGPIVDTNALIQALDSGRLGGACLDVYEFEKGLFFENHTNDILHDSLFSRLRSFKNVLITGHQGFLTQEAINEIAATTIANCTSFQNRMVCENEVGFMEKAMIASA